MGRKVALKKRILTSLENNRRNRSEAISTPEENMHKNKNFQRICESKRHKQSKLNVLKSISKFKNEIRPLTKIPVRTLKTVAANNIRNSYDKPNSVTKTGKTSFVADREKSTNCLTPSKEVPDLLLGDRSYLTCITSTESKVEDQVFLRKIDFNDYLRNDVSTVNSSVFMLKHFQKLFEHITRSRETGSQHPMLSTEEVKLLIRILNTDNDYHALKKEDCSLMYEILLQQLNEIEAQETILKEILKQIESNSTFNDDKDLKKKLLYKIEWCGDMKERHLKKIDSTKNFPSEFLLAEQLLDESKGLKKIFQKSNSSTESFCCLNFDEILNTSQSSASYPSYAWSFDSIPSELKFRSESEKFRWDKTTLMYPHQSKNIQLLTLEQASLYSTSQNNKKEDPDLSDEDLLLEKEIDALKEKTKGSITSGKNYDKLLLEKIKFQLEKARKIADQILKDCKDKTHLNVPNDESFFTHIAGDFVTKSVPVFENIPKNFEDVDRKAEDAITLDKSENQLSEFGIDESPEITKSEKLTRIDSTLADLPEDYCGNLFEGNHGPISQNVQPKNYTIFASKRTEYNSEEENENISLSNINATPTVNVSKKLNQFKGKSSDAKSFSVYGIPKKYLILIPNFLLCFLLVFGLLLQPDITC